MKVELSRFRVKAGKSACVDEWLKMLNDNIDEVIQTLEREQMKLEVIFRECIGQEEYLTWFSVQGEAGDPVKTSPYAVDQQHMQFEEECIGHDFGMRDGQPQVILDHERVAEAMAWPQARSDVVVFQRRERVHRRTSPPPTGKTG
ncbi:MAG: DUF6176 family protein [Anaerolineales bacterium]